MRKTEYPHNTPEQVAEYLSAAAEIVGGLELDDDLKEIAFSKAVDLCASKQVFFEEASLGGLGRGLRQ